MDVNEDFIESESLKLPFILRLCFFADKLLRLPAMRQDGTLLNRRLTDLFAFKASAQKEPVCGVSSKDVVIDKGTGVWVRIYTPHEGSIAMASSMDEETTTERVPIIFYFHGGGFAFLHANFTYYDAFCTRLCRNYAAAVISVDYKRSPEHRYPVAYDDCFSALKWLKSDGQEHIPIPVDISRCFLMGDSAGGNIVHHVTSMAAAAKGDLSPLTVIGSLLLFPFFGGEERTPAEMRLRDAPVASLRGCDWCWKAYLPKGSNRDHPAANVIGPRAPDLTKLPLPPCMVVIAEFDPLKDWQLRFCEKMKQSGKEVQMEYYKGAIHAFHLFPQLELASTLLMTMHKFVQARCDVAIAGTGRPQPDSL